MRPTLIRLLTGLLLCSLPGLAVAQGQSSRDQRLHPQAGAMCRAECLQTAQSRLGSNPAQAARACEIRCAATMGFLQNQNRRGSAEATGRGQAAGLAQPVLHRVQQPAPQMAPQMAPVRPASTRTPVTHGVIYGARTPSAAFGLVVGEPDRMTAHRLAERGCTAGGPGCRVIAETTEACAAAAHGVKRSQWALFMTSDPSSYTVTSLSAGSGRTQIAAEQQAIAECRSRDPMATCRIAASACANRG
ncbi:DUF4189 domain-containing protein [Falsiroseomonas tokyonensis]|uniref:DUF4189 domain-containing protein n=1 Tax=Falsiroseomonas tokyonensis TaxID=430521 RepID=A0ABV7BTI2_9PROT|nr:DUF4189 domain-containing protein [Falsiroseomonas tokyonensis]MBU8538953.1 DUF4189 domain-containing protein [Falsiroseomonas tokyonensis]